MARHGVGNLSMLCHGEIQQALFLHQFDGVLNRGFDGDGDPFMNHDLLGFQGGQILTGFQRPEKIELADESDELIAFIDDRRAGSMSRQQFQRGGHSVLADAQNQAIGSPDLSDCTQSSRRDSR